MPDVSPGARPGLLERLTTTPAAVAILGDTARLQAMLDVEAALARAEARLGVIPAGAAGPIAAACRAEFFDLAQLAEAAEAGGNLAIPMVKRLTALVAETDPEAARYVHWGATSQDIIDTGQVLQLRALLDLLGVDLIRACEAAAALAERHAGTVMAGRTWLQQALPITFGLKAAGWLDALARQAARLDEIRPRLLVVQFGGASGTQAALEDRGHAVMAGMAAELHLGLPSLPWHGQRDRIAEIGAAFGLLIGTTAKIARDIGLLMQNEVAEVFEGAAPGKGGSSTMPHKRNPVLAASILSAQQRAPGLVAGLMGAMAQEHERGLGGWQAEWSLLPELGLLAAGAVAKLADGLPLLEIRAEAMRRNLDVTNGLIMAEAVTMALGKKMGRMAAHQVVETACKKAAAEGRHLREILGTEPEVIKALKGERPLDELFNPASYLGDTAGMIERTLKAYRAGRGVR